MRALDLEMSELEFPLRVSSISLFFLCIRLPFLLTALARTTMDVTRSSSEVRVNTSIPGVSMTMTNVTTTSVTTTGESTITTITTTTNITNRIISSRADSLEADLTETTTEVATTPPAATPPITENVNKLTTTTTAMPLVTKSIPSCKQDGCHLKKDKTGIVCCKAYPNPNPNLSGNIKYLHQYESPTCDPPKYFNAIQSNCM